jgi:hypothetical protein
MSKESRLADANNNFLIGFSFEMVQVLSIAKLEKKKLKNNFIKQFSNAPIFRAAAYFSPPSAPYFEHRQDRHISFSS